jgi:hypothetical protein
VFSTAFIIGFRVFVRRRFMRFQPEDILLHDGAAIVADFRDRALRGESAAASGRR